eukprot:1159166-Pelagomonas_calceolata.AAC.2
MVHKELLLPCSWHVAFCHWLSCTHCLCIASTLHAPLPRSPTHFPANGPVLTAHAGLHAGISTITFSRPPALLAAVETCSDDGGPDVVAGGYSSRCRCVCVSIEAGIVQQRRQTACTLIQDVASLSNGML